MNNCAADDCSKSIHAGGLCRRHYDQARSASPGAKARKADSQRRWATANAEAVAAKRRAYNEAHREQNNATKRAWLAANPGKKAARAATLKAWAATNPEKIAEYQRRYREAHPDVRAGNSGRSYARKKKAPVVVNVDRGAIWARDGGVCQVCLTPVDQENWHLDHIVPLALAGAHAPDNAAVTHPGCNRQKGNRDPREPGSPYAHMLARP